MLNLNDLKVGDSVRFVDGQVAKVVDIIGKDKETVYVHFDKEVASDTEEDTPLYETAWFYYYNGEIAGLTNHITEIIKKGEENEN